MSYILDALKKADRQRNLSKVPTLTTFHIPVYVTGRRLAIWVVAGMLLCGGLLVWFLQPSPTGVPVADVPPPTSVGVSPQASGADLERAPLSTQATSPPDPPLVEPPSAAPSAGSRREVSRQPERKSDAPPRLRQTSPRQPP